jgi:hypothetical protein
LRRQNRQATYTYVYLYLAGECYGNVST